MFTATDLVHISVACSEREIERVYGQRFGRDFCGVLRAGD